MNTQEATSTSTIINTFTVFNVQGLAPKTVNSSVPYIHDVLHDNKQFFINLTETWLFDHKEAELQIPGYKLFRSDRKRINRSDRGRFSGGVAIYLRNDVAINFEESLVYSNGVVEVLCLYSKSDNIMVINIYRQPDNSKHRSTLAEFTSALKAISKILNPLNPAPTIFMSGDFNLPHIDWNKEMPSPSATAIEKLCFSALKSFMDCNSLFQHITEPTHYQGNVLDLLFTNLSELVYEVKYFDPLLSVSHHRVIEVSTTFSFGAKSYIDNSNKGQRTNVVPPLSTLNFQHDDIDWNSLEQDLLSIDWDFEFSKLSLEKIVQRLLDISYECALSYVPPKRNKQRVKSKIPKDRRRLMTRRRRVNQRLLQVKSEAIKLKLKKELIEIEKKLQSSYSSSRQYKEIQAIQSIKKNSKFFYSFAKQFSKLSSPVGPLKVGNKLVSGDIEMADILADHFSSVFSNPSHQAPNFYDMVNAETFPLLNEVLFDESDFIEALGNLKSSSGSGPYGFPSIYLKKCKTSLSKPLNILWHRSMESGKVPDCLKTTDIIPLHKKDSLGCPENYRPIANSSHLIKVFEKVIRKNLGSYLEENNFLNPNQHGFRNGRSCLSQLLAQYDKILECMEEGNGVDVVYLDFGKAFDKVDINLLLQKIKKCGIGGKLGNWLHDFLTNRCQTVLVNGCRSKVILVISGVPQGSVLGPLLFLIFISDIDLSVKQSSLSSFADDTKLTKSISSTKDASDLQCDLNAVYSWAVDNNMVFNNDKFELLRYNTSAVQVPFQYIDCDNEFILEKDSVKDLGVLMTNNGKFSSHIQNVCSSMKKMSGWILRTFKSRSKLVMLTTWKSLVLPLHDYCSQLWNPSKPGEIQSLELLQWYFIRKIKGTFFNDYWDALDCLNMLSLQRRRERYQIIYVWKIMEDLVPNPVIASDNDSSKLITFNVSPRRGRFCVLPNIKSTAPVLVKNLRYNSFHMHSCRLFNLLPKDLRDLTGCDTEHFKIKLDIFLATLPDTPNLPSLRKFCSASSNSIIDICS